MRRIGFLAALLATAPMAWAFCGFYVAQEPGALSNRASKVVLVRDGDHTVLTMANDYEGAAESFAVVVPVPQAIEPDQVRVVSGDVVGKLDQYTVPRLAEYFDPDPCIRLSNGDALGALGYNASRAGAGQLGDSDGSFAEIARSYGVHVEQTYAVAEYDITIVEAEQGTGLGDWLAHEGWQVPEGSGPILDSYVGQGMHFFLAKVDLGRREAGSRWLHPLQVRYDSPKFMLPIRLGTVNATGPQDLVILALTAHGRVETTNYRTAEIPADLDLPEYLADQANFGTFYGALFDHQVQRDGRDDVYLEYAWPLSVTCDPCSGANLSDEELHDLGATWARSYHGGIDGGFVTRLHVRYDAAHFPEDLVFQETADTAPWQARYVVHHRFTGDTSCNGGAAYVETLAIRQQQEVARLSRYTGWSPERIQAFVPR